MLDIVNQVEHNSSLSEELGYLKFFKYMLDYIDEPENTVIFAGELIELMHQYKEENYPERKDK